MMDYYKSMMDYYKSQDYAIPGTTQSFTVRLFSTKRLHENVAPP